MSFKDTPTAGFTAVVLAMGLSFGISNAAKAAVDIGSLGLKDPNMNAASSWVNDDYYTNSEYSGRQHRRISWRPSGYVAANERFTPDHDNALIVESFAARNQPVQENLPIYLVFDGPRASGPILRLNSEFSGLPIQRLSDPVNSRVSAVPLPPTLPLLVAGFAGFAIAGRRWSSLKRRPG